MKWTRLFTTSAETQENTQNVICRCTQDRQKYEVVLGTGTRVPVSIATHGVSKFSNTQKSEANPSTTVSAYPIDATS